MALATSELADLMSGTLAEEIASAASDGMRVYAVTSPATVRTTRSS